MVKTRVPMMIQDPKITKCRGFERIVEHPYVGRTFSLTGR